jgi:hypothetical protein
MPLLALINSIVPVAVRNNEGVISNAWTAKIIREAKSALPTVE